MCFWFLTHTCSLQSLSTVTSSTLRLWVAFCYPHFWSSRWCHDSVMIIRKSNSSLENSFLKRVALIYFQKSCFEDSSQAAYIFSCENDTFPHAAFNQGVNFSHCNHWQGANIFLQRKKIRFSSLLEGNLLEGWVGIRMVVQKLAFQIYWDHSYPSN